MCVDATSFQQKTVQYAKENSYNLTKDAYYGGNGEHLMSRVQRRPEEMNWISGNFGFLYCSLISGFIA